MTDVLDAGTLERLRRIGGETLVERMIQVFIENAPARVDRVIEAASAGDAGGVEQAAHSLKSMAANIGALRLYALSERAELNAADGDSRLADHAASIADEFERVRAALVARGNDA